MKASHYGSLKSLSTGDQNDTNAAKLQLLSSLFLSIELLGLFLSHPNAGNGGIHWHYLEVQSSSSFHRLRRRSPQSAIVVESLLVFIRLMCLRMPLERTTLILACVLKITDNSFPGSISKNHGHFSTPLQSLSICFTTGLCQTLRRSPPESAPSSSGTDDYSVSSLCTNDPVF